MKVNFAELTFQPNLFTSAEPMPGISKQIAQAIWTSGFVSQNIEDYHKAADLVKSLFEYTEMDIQPNEAEIIRKAIDNWQLWAKMPIIEALEAVR